jgi:4-aminobutyrate aminotransferase-like enzyme
VRGRGLLLAFKVSGLNHPDDPEGASYCADLLMENGVLVGQAAHDPAWIKLTPALTIGDDDIEQFLDVLEGCLSAVAAERGA